MINAIKRKLESGPTKYPEASGLCRQLLSETLDFMTSLNTFISDTYEDLTDVGFPDTNAWDLVSKLVNRIFAEDCFVRRGIVHEYMDSNDHRALGVSLIWGTFATHQVIREYQSYGIENHPSIASEYVRFLVYNSGAHKIELLEARCLNLENKVKEMSKTIESIQKTASNGANKADDAKKKAEEALKLAKQALAKK